MHTCILVAGTSVRLLNLIHSVTCMGVPPMSAHYVHAVPQTPKEGGRSPWDQRYRRLRAGKAPSAPKTRAISPAPSGVNVPLEVRRRACARMLWPHFILKETQHSCLTT